MTRAADHLQVLCGRYGRGLLPTLDACLRAGKLALYKMLDEMEVDFIERAELAALDPTGRSFVNVNTPEDLRAAELLAAREAGPRP